MNLVGPRRVEALLALGCGMWVVLWLLGEGLVVTAGLAIPAALASACYRRLPLVAVLGVAGLSLLGPLLGISSENPWLLPVLCVAAYGLGRYGTRLGAGVALVVFVTVWASAGDPVMGNVIFGLLVGGGVWTFGVLVRRQAVAAARAVAEAGALAAHDPTVRAAQAVAEERARLAGDALAVVRGAVVAMQRHAADAADDLEPAAIEAIQDEGRRATQDLRRLLGLLRSEPAITAATQAPPEARRPRRGALVGPVAVGLLLLREAGAELHLAGRLEALAVVLAVALAATVLLRHFHPAIACVAAALPPAVALATDTALFYELWVGIVCMLLAWAVTTSPTTRLRDYGALAVFLGVLVLDVRLHDPGNEAITLAFGLVPAVTGHLWVRRRREHHTAAVVAAGLRAERDEAAERAVRAERVRLARELHDVTSHSVGVMVLQAGAAAVLRETSPEDARAAVRHVQAAGKQALSELDALFGLLEAGAVGTAGHASGSARNELCPALEEMAERMRHAGLDVTLSVDPSLPGDPVVSSTTYRVVQEALTNAARYAPGAVVEVALREHAAALEVVVRDDGPRSSPAPSALGSGFGLMGLDERLRDLGGELTAGPWPGGGFEVKARLPVDRRVEVAF
jgi:signal transduction histidine kinase